MQKNLYNKKKSDIDEPIYHQKNTVYIHTHPVTMNSIKIPSELANKKNLFQREREIEIPTLKKTSHHTKNIMRDHKNHQNIFQSKK